MKIVIGVAALVLAGASPSFAQNTFPPASFTNLQVLPKDSPARVVVGTMKGFAMNLGVRCQFCHVGKEGLPRRVRFRVGRDRAEENRADHDATDRRHQQAARCRRAAGRGRGSPGDLHHLPPRQVNADEH